MVAKKSTLADLAPGILPGREITWRCWRIRGGYCEPDERGERHPDRTRIAGPVEVEAQTFVVARKRACVPLGCEEGHVECEYVLPEPKPMAELLKQTRVRPFFRPLKISAEDLAMRAAEDRARLKKLRKPARFKASKLNVARK